MTEALIILRKKYKMPVTGIHGKKDDNSNVFKAVTREGISGVTLQAIIYHPIVSSHYGFAWNYKV